MSVALAPAAATRGHSAAHPGLRGHSCGEHYPLHVQAVGSGPTQYLQWQVVNLRTGRTGHPRRSYQEALIDLVSIRIRDLQHS